MLIVVVGLLAVLGLMGITFATLMRLERAAARNRNEQMMAYRAARAGIDYVAAQLRSESADADQENDDWDSLGTSSVCPVRHSGAPASYGTTDDDYYYFCRLTEQRDPFIAGFALHNHNSASGHLNDLYQGASVTDEERRFNINRMGWLGDLGSEADERQRISSVQASLARLLDAKISSVYSNATTRHRKAVLLASAIVKYRLGPDERPGQKGYDDYTAEHRPGWHWKGNWSDGGTAYPGNTNDKYELGYGDGYPSLLRLASTLYFYAESNVWRGQSGASTWNEDIGATSDGTGGGTSYPNAGDPSRRAGYHDGIPSAVRYSDGALYYEGNTTAEEGMDTDAKKRFYLIDEPYEIGLPRKVLARGKVDSSTNTTLDVSPDPQWGTNDWQYCYVRIFNGVGKGQERKIASNTSDRLTVSTAWSVNPGTVAGKDAWFEIYGEGREPAVTGTIIGYSAPTIDVSAALGSTDYADYYVLAVSTAGAGQIRRIASNTANSITPSTAWKTAPSVNDKFEIVVISQDRPYTSLEQIIGVMKTALQADGEAEAAAQDNAEAIYEAVKDSIAVGTYEGRGYPNAANVRDRVSINDWSKDRMDNDGDGAIDEDDEGWTAAELRKRLGLDALVSGGVLTQNQADKLTANIIDFRDTDNEPTPVGTQYGSEGLHLTEVLAAPVPILGAAAYSACSVFDDGDSEDPADGFAWSWDAGLGVTGAWVQRDDDPEEIGTWTFSGLKNGYYAIRIFGASGHTLKFKFGTLPFYTVATSRSLTIGADTYYYAYVRKTGDPSDLVVVQVTAGTLSFQIQAAQNQEFHGFQLLPQFIEFTNVAMQSPMLTSDHGISISGHTLKIKTSATESMSIPAGHRVPAPYADGRFPINYGHYVVALSEEAYDMQWGTNKDGAWGTGASASTNEAYIATCWFIGDEGANNSARNANADKFYFVYGDTPDITLENASATVIAGGYIDGALSLALANYKPVQKTTLLGTTWETYVGSKSGDLVSSQNREVTTSWECGTVTSSAGATLTTGPTCWRWTASLWDGFDVVIVSGAGQGQRRSISSHTTGEPHVSKSFTVGGAWSPNPDSTSRFEIRRTVRTSLNERCAPLWTFDSGTVDSATGSSLTTTAAGTSWAWRGADLWQDYYVAITSGPAQGEVQRISSNTTGAAGDAKTVNLTTGWATVPGNGDTFEIRGYGDADGSRRMNFLQNLRGSRRVLPIILNRSYPSPGWLGLVPSGTDWRTIDPDPTPASGAYPATTPTPAGPHELLGYLAQRALVGGVYSRININTADVKSADGSNDTDRAVLKSLFRDETAQQIQSDRPWSNLDELLNEDLAATYDGSSHFAYYGNMREDSGACSFVDDFPDDSDEREEWYRRFANLITLRSNVFRVLSHGAVFDRGETTPVAHARIEAWIDRGTDTDGDGKPDVRILNMRFLTEYDK